MQSGRAAGGKNTRKYRNPNGTQRDRKHHDRIDVGRNFKKVVNLFVEYFSPGHPTQTIFDLIDVAHK